VSVVDVIDALERAPRQGAAVDAEYFGSAQ